MRPAVLGGCGKGSILSEALRRKPYSVLLLDEVKRAHPVVNESFFRIFDKGTLEDAEGRRIDFRHTLILLTSNIGSELLTVGDSDASALPENATLLPRLHALLLKTFPAAFLGRVNVVPYFSLCRTSLDVIVRMQLSKVITRLEQQSLVLKYSDDIVSFIIERCQSVTSGAREIIHVIGKEILPVIATFLLSRPQNRRDEQETLFLSYTADQGLALVVDYPENKEVEL